MPVTCPCPGTQWRLIYGGFSWFPTLTDYNPVLINVPDGSGNAIYPGQDQSNGLHVPGNFPTGTDTTFSVAYPQTDGTFKIYLFSGICVSHPMGQTIYYICLVSQVSSTPLTPSGPAKKSTAAVACTSTSADPGAQANAVIAAGPDFTTVGYIDGSGVLNVCSGTAYNDGDAITLSWIASDGTLYSQSGTYSASSGEWVTS